MRSFLAATARGYQDAAEAPEVAGELMCQTVIDQHDTHLGKGLVIDSMQMLSEVSLQYSKTALSGYILVLYASASC